MYGLQKISHQAIILDAPSSTGAMGRMTYGSRLQNSAQFLWKGGPLRQVINAKKNQRIIITEIDNCTDRYISTEMIRDVFESVAATMEDLPSS